MVELLRVIHMKIFHQQAMFRSVSGLILNKSVELAGIDEVEEIEIMTDQHHIILKQISHYFAID